MTQAEIEEFINGLPNVEHQDAMGYRFFFVGEDRMSPFATIAGSDSEYDRRSKLDRAGVYRINFGVSKVTFDNLVGDMSVDGCDYAQLNVFMPHPDYAKQRFVCILAPTGNQMALTKTLLEESHRIWTERQRHKNKKDKENIAT